MRITRKLAMLAAVPAVAALMAAGASGIAQAKVVPLNTGSCGPTCVEPYFLLPGKTWVQIDAKGADKVNNPINLQYRTTTNAAEDFSPSDSSTVVPEFCPSTTQAALDPVFSAAQCALLANANLDSSPAWQMRYSPLGVYTGMCVGIWNDSGTGGPGSRIRLEKCGVSRSTVWIEDTNVVNPDHTAPYINGASSNFSDPLVITEATGAPAVQKLELEQLNIDTSGIVSSQQLVGLLPGL